MKRLTLHVCTSCLRAVRTQSGVEAISDAAGVHYSSTDFDERALCKGTFRVFTMGPELRPVRK